MPATPRRAPPATAIVLAAGTGGRGIFAPAWALAAGRPVCAWAVDALDASPHIARVALVVDEGHLPRADRMVAAAGWHNVRLMAPMTDAEGTPDLAVALRAGLSALADVPAESVLLHDGARPLLPTSVLDNLFNAWDGEHVIAAANPVKETLKAVDARLRVRQTPPRDRLWQLHPPLLAPRSLLEHILTSDSPPAPDREAPTKNLASLLVRAPHARLRLVPAGHDDLMVRRHADLRLVEQMLQTYVTTRQPSDAI